MKTPIAPSSRVAREALARLKSVQIASIIGLDRSVASLANSRMTLKMRVCVQEALFIDTPHPSLLPQGARELVSL